MTLKFTKQVNLNQNLLKSKFLKILAPSISQIISNLINISILNGIYPDCLKIASIKPLHKKDSNLLTGNYRPISLLSNLNKIFEKIIHTRLYLFLENKKCFYKHQPIRFQKKTQHNSCDYSFNWRNQRSSWQWRFCHWRLHWPSKGIWHSRTLYTFRKTFKLRH